MKHIVGYHRHGAAGPVLPDEPPLVRLERMESQIVDLESQISRTDASVWPDEHQRLLVLLRHRRAGVEYQRRVVLGGSIQ